MVSLMDDDLLPLTTCTQVPPELDRIVVKALQKHKKERYQNARQLAHDLKTLKRELQLQGRLNQSVVTDIQPERIQTDRPRTASNPAQRSSSTADLALVQRTLRVRYLVREIKRRRFAAALAVAVVIAAVFAPVYFVHRAPRAELVSTGSDRDAIAVLPFAYSPSDPGTVYFNPPDKEDPSFRICEGIINDLSRLTSLKVT